jgi:hypothetical protein
MSMKATIAAEFQQVAKEQKKALLLLSDGLSFTRLGLYLGRAVFPRRYRTLLQNRSSPR